MTAADAVDGRENSATDLLDDLFPSEITALLVASGYSVLGWVDLNRQNLETTETK